MKLPIIFIKEKKLNFKLFPGFTEVKISLKPTFRQVLLKKGSPLSNFNLEVVKIKLKLIFAWSPLSEQIIILRPNIVKPSYFLRALFLCL